MEALLLFYRVIANFQFGLTLPSSMLHLVKLGCSHASEPEVVKSLIIQDNLTSYIHVKAHKISSDSNISFLV